MLLDDKKCRNINAIAICMVATRTERESSLSDSVQSADEAPQRRAAVRL